MILFAFILQIHCTTATKISSSEVVKKQSDNNDENATINEPQINSFDTKNKDQSRITEPGSSDKTEASEENGYSNVLLAARKPYISSFPETDENLTQ